MTANGDLYEIRFGDQSAVIAAVAGTLLSWQVAGDERLLTYSADQVGDSYQGKTILPWPNRIDAGRYSFAGNDYQLPVNEPRHNAALHGLLSWTEWSLASHTDNSVTLQHTLIPQYCYPFRLAFQLEHTLTEDGLHITLTAHNVGATAAPFGAAHHPYLGTGSATLTTAQLCLPAHTYYPVDHRMMPTGKTSVAGTDYDFRTLRTLNSTAIDNAFTDLDRDSTGNAVIRFVDPQGRTTDLWVDQSYPYLQVYTDDNAPAHRTPRSGITIEPMTCAPDAFNNGDGLIVLEPDQRWQGSWGFRAIS